MTLGHGNPWCITGPLCGESTDNHFDVFKLHIDVPLFVCIILLQSENKC